MELYQQVIAFFVVFFIILLLFFLYTQYSVNKKQIKLINRDGKTIELSVEIADDPVKRARGLMFRESLGEYEGMLFVFDRPKKPGFWMVNTTIPLDAIFFDENKTVVDIIAMNPCNITDCPSYAPEKDSLYVLEVNQGFSDTNKIEKGRSKMVLG